MVTKKKVTKKKAKRKVAGRAAPKKKLPGWIVLFLGMLFGIMIAIFGYINGWVPKPDNPNAGPIAQKEQTKSTSKVEDKSQDLEIIQKKGYDFFYDELPNMEVAIDYEEVQQTNSRKPKMYVIQLGSFKSLKDAETMKAKIAFTGMSANIEVANVDGVNWHRLRIGPYKSSRKADVDKRGLEKNGFNAILLPIL